MGRIDRTGKIEGGDEIVDNLDIAAHGIVGASGRGVLKAVLFIMKESMKLVPIRLGNLRNSRFIVSSVPGLDITGVGKAGSFKGGNTDELSSDHAEIKAETSSEVATMDKGGSAPTAALGYSAVYALSVHENPNAGGAGNTGEADKQRKGKKKPLSTIHSKRGFWKFLEGPLKAFEGKILDIIKQEAKFD